MIKRAFGDLELEILQILKSQPRMSVKQVHQCLGEKDKYNTIMTVLVRLTEKKKLAREKVGMHYEYWLLPSTPVSFFDQMKKKLFGVKKSEMISYLIESAEDISSEELAEIEKIVERAKNKI